MQYNKFTQIIASLVGVVFTQYAVAACAGTDCFSQGVDFGNQAKTSGSIISNSILESAVGAQNMSAAQANQDAIQNTMGGDYKNIDGITNSGNSKAQACVGKNTSDCNAYNFYNDPLTRQNQQGLESAVGMASNLINKQINQNVDITAYCETHPNDSTCKSCQADPSQAMCQSGNKCTTITYNTGSTIEQSNACEIIGQRSYDCNSWVDDVVFHYDYVPASPADGSVMAQGANQDTSKTYCAINASITSNEALTAQNQISINVNSRNDDGGWNITKDFNYSMTGTGYQYAYQNNNNGNTNKTMIGSVGSGVCNGNSCSLSFTTQCNHGQLGGNDWNRSATVTLNYTKPTVSSNTLVIDKVTQKDNCSK
ncbi:MAG: hypothetical protein K2Y14_01225 [Burkholderiales bacterium]|nr:hypothetical protein [Burkholderiales bacterium]